jgi:hypothetical protein
LRLLQHIGTVGEKIERGENDRNYSRAEAGDMSLIDPPPSKNTAAVFKIVDT